METRACHSDSETVTLLPDTNWLISKATFNIIDPRGVTRSNTIVFTYGPVTELGDVTAVLKREKTESWTIPPESEVIEQTIASTFEYSDDLPNQEDFRLSRFGL